MKELYFLCLFARLFVMRKNGLKPYFYAIETKLRDMTYPLSLGICVAGKRALDRDSACEGASYE